MRKILIGIFMLSIVSLFAAVTLNNDPVPSKKTPVKMDENKSPNHQTDVYSEVAQHIADCFQVSVSDVSVTASLHLFTIISLSYTSSIVWSSCSPSPCSHGCIRVLPDYHECCFDVPYIVM